MVKGYRTCIEILCILCHCSVASALLCLSCSNVDDVRNCFTLEQCGPHQTCFSYRFIKDGGREVYNLGCMDNIACAQSSLMGKRDNDAVQTELSEHLFLRRSGHLSKVKRSEDFVPCLQCCDGTDACNKNLCSAPAVNLRCTECSDVVETAHCNKLAVCGKDEFCFVQRAPHHLSPGLRYQMGCMGFKQCNALQNSFQQYCTKCCNGSDLCNYDACENWSFEQTHTVTTTTATTKPETTSVKQPTTTSPQLVINGPHNSSYLSQVVLECITLPAAQSYIWMFNNTSVLPEGVIAEKKKNIDGTLLLGIEKLIISQLNESNIGIYTCIGHINGYTLKQNHSITVNQEVPSVQIIKPVVTTNFALICNVTGYPPPHVGWAFVKAGAHTSTADLPSDVQVV